MQATATPVVMSAAQRAWATRRAAAGQAYAPGAKSAKAAKPSKLAGARVSRLEKHDSLRLTATFASGERLVYSVTRSGSSLSADSKDAAAKGVLNLLFAQIKPQGSETYTKCFDRLEAGLRQSASLAAFVGMILG